MALVGLLRRLSIPPRGDYVEAFQELVAAGQEHALRHDGTTRLRLAEAALAVGDYGRALEEARRLVLDHVPDAHVHLLRGLSALGALATELLHIPAGPGTAPPDIESVDGLAREARMAFERVLELVPADERARLGVEALDEMVREAAVCPVTATSSP